MQDQQPADVSGTMSLPPVYTIVFRLGSLISRSERLLLGDSRANPTPGVLGLAV